MNSGTVYSLLSLLLVVLLALRQGPAALVCALLLLTAAMAQLWNRWAHVRLSCSRVLSASHAFPGDQIDLTVRIVNRKPLPLVGVVIRFGIPADLEASGSGVSRDGRGRQQIRRIANLGPYEALTWHYRLHCRRRGAFRIGAGTIDAGDPFGFYRSGVELPPGARLIVYPLALPLEELTLAARSPLGQRRARQLITDPMRTIGVRDYHPDDPLKDVHWAATARVGTLQTRIYETTTARELAIFLDLDTFTRYWEGLDLAQFERIIAAAATLTGRAIEAGDSVGLYANGAPAEHAQAATVPPGRSPAQHMRILETLAQLTPHSIMPIARLLRLSAAALPWGATILLVSVVATDATRAAVLRLRERGRSVVWLYLGEDAPPTIPGVVVHYAPPAQDWRANR
ncbi:MAG TPA: DUF58 domain-containing protein [Roseiflexaceae bacterium]|nr:DUF58 domain-containing protein [Roseiflexaceae bacterium]HMP43172.1 DUF58 domain-containing protein [Roseiflexaceae bacterium]